MNKTNKRAFVLFAIIALLSGGVVAAALVVNGFEIW